VSPLKVLSTISVVALTAFLFLSPFAAYAAGATVTVKTDQPSYFSAQTGSIFGTVTPAPTTSGTQIVITVKNPSGSQVLFNEVSVSTSDGSYSYQFVTGGPNWVTGTYKVNATYAPAGSSATGSAVTTFSYSASTGGGGGGGISQGQFNDIMGNITALNGKLDTVSAALTALQNGQSAQNTQLTTIVNSLNTLTGTVTSIQGSLTGFSNTLGQVNTAVGGISTQFTQLSGPLASAGQTQTYVLVVAVLTAITLVLVLAVLVRRLS